MSSNFWSNLCIGICCAMILGIMFLFFDEVLGGEEVEPAVVIGTWHRARYKTKERRGPWKMQYDVDVWHEAQWWVKAKTSNWQWDILVNEADFNRCPEGSKVELIIGRGRWTAWRYRARLK